MEYRFEYKQFGILPGLIGDILQSIQALPGERVLMKVLPISMCEAVQMTKI
jgi:hypothetical protein